jgi:hypothetical protein
MELSENAEPYVEVDERLACDEEALERLLRDGFLSLHKIPTDSGAR